MERASVGAGMRKVIVQEMTVCRRSTHHAMRGATGLRTDPAALHPGGMTTARRKVAGFLKTMLTLTDSWGCVFARYTVLPYRGHFSRRAIFCGGLIFSVFTVGHRPQQFNSLIIHIHILVLVLFVWVRDSTCLQWEMALLQYFRSVPRE